LLRRIALLSSLMLAPSAGGARAPQDASESAATLGQRAMAIVAEYEDARRSFRSAYGQAADDAERRRITAEQAPRVDQYGARVLAVLEPAPEDPGGVPALVWVLSTAEDERLFERAAELIARHHLGSDGIPAACRAAEDRLTPGARFLEAVARGSQRGDLRALARFSLARNTLERADHARRLAEAGPEERAYLAGRAGADLARESPTRLLLEAEALLAAVASEAPDVPSPSHGTLGAACASELFELRRLQVGMPAPEIEGEDLDGVPFKLSDYRGKVVVLDFWGNW